MYLMFGDEADAEQGRGQKFFVYGAVFVDAANVQVLHDGIQDIRDKSGYDGSTFQAKRDTGQPPSHADWLCLAAAGRDGGSITVRGTFNETP